MVFDKRQKKAHICRRRKKRRKKESIVWKQLSGDEFKESRADKYGR